MKHVLLAMTFSALTTHQALVTQKTSGGFDQDFRQFQRMELTDPRAPEIPCAYGIIRPSGCLCTKDDDCGVGHKCCPEDFAS